MKEEETGEQTTIPTNMAELTKAKRKRTTKKNIVLRNIMIDCEAVVNSPKTEEAIKDAEVLLLTLSEAVNEVRALDETVSDLTVDD